MDDNLAQQIKEAEAAVIVTEKSHGPDAPELADKLHHYAVLLRQTEKRALDAVNVEARARAIRAKMYAEEERLKGTSGTLPGSKKKSTQPPAWSMYIGIAAVFVSLFSLFAPQYLLLWLVGIALMLGVADLLLSSGVYWRIALTVVFTLSAWYSNQVLPENLLTDQSPIERFNYATRNPEVVANSHKLGKPIKVLSYSICLPEGFVAQGDDKQDWGRMVSWLGGDGASPTGPQMSLILMKVPDSDGKKTSNISLLKTARDVAMPQLATILNLQDFKSVTPEEVDINGTEFAKVTFTGQIGDQDRNGFAYTAINGRILIMVVGHDSATVPDEALKEMDASVFSFQKRKNSGDLADLE
jgi:hypothetical protein